MDDPWDWDVDRVVQEFCTPNRSWKPNREPPALPPLDQLEAALREQETDGFTLLAYHDHAELHRELGIKKLNQRATFRDAIEQFRKRSLKYQQHQSGQEDPAEDQDVPPKPRVQLASPKRLLAALTSFKALDGSEPQKEAVRTIAPAETPDPAPSFAHSPPTASTVHLPSAVEPAQKKRRITPTIVTTDIDANVTRNIPTAADEILGVSSNVLPAPASATDPSEAYLGLDAMTRIEMTELDSPITARPLTQEARTFSFLRPRHVPRGRQLQIHRIFKRRLLPKQTPDRLIPTKPDTVFGTNDPNRDEVLPLYGESDSEYDSETWEEMEAEFDERATGGTVPTGLTTDKVNSVIDEEIQHLIDNWRDHRLLKLRRSAFKIWSQPRKRGYLRIAIDNERQLVRDLEGRIAKYREKILEQQYYNAADVRSMCRIFEQTVDEKETASWKVDILSSPEEPQKPTQISRASIRKPRKVQPVGDDGSEILTSESEDGMDDFIVDDDVPLTNAPGSPMDISEHYPPASPMNLSDHHSPLGSPVTNKVRDAMDKDGSAPGSNQTRSNNTDAPSVYHNPRTPSKGQSSHPHIIDLTITPDKGALGNNDSPIRRESHNPVRIKFKSEVRGSQSSSKDKYKGPSSLVMSIDDLGDVEGLIAGQLSKLGQKFLSTIFTLACDVKPEVIWKDLILPALRLPMFPQAPYSDEGNDFLVGFRLIRLFDIWLGKGLQNWSHYKRLTESDKQKIRKDGEEKQEDWERFVDFLKRISDRFEWTKVKIQKKNGQWRSSPTVKTSHRAGNDPISDLDDYGPVDDGVNGDDADGSPSQKKKRRVKIVRNKEAQNLREGNQIRMREQEVRRNQLRVQLEQLEASGAVMNSQRAMIINESKEEDQGFIYIHDEIASRIKEHQVAGVRFMWNQIVAKSETRQGCLLAHTMGLGKTMQIITLLVAIAQAASSDDDSIRSQIPDDLRESKTLIICPPGLVNNWLDELLSWTPEDHGLGDFYKLDSQMPAQERGPTILAWAERGGILVIGYQLLQQCMEDKALEKTLIEAPSLVVADEAHSMKNPKSKTHIKTASFRTQSRIALTGSPLANNVEEYHAMINWVAPNYLSDLHEFRQDYATPIRDGLSVESTPWQRRKALARLYALKQTVGPKVHRLTIATLKHDIPPKIEFVLTVPLTQVQKTAYERYVESQQRIATEENATSMIFASLNNLSLLCAHPNCFLKFLEQKSVGQKGTSKNKQKAGQESDVALPPNLVSDQISILRKTKDIDWLFHSWKIPILTAILDECQRVGDSVLVFSHSIPTLNYLENILRLQKRTVQRLDGSTAINSRQAMVKDFNKIGAKVFLISTTAGGLGLNITGANRVVIFDFKFNPQHEQQAVGRAYRLGQTKPVFVYRFVCGGTFEEKQLNRSIFKMQLADRVVDKKNPIPKASHFGELLQMPFDPEQKDISEHRGRDVVIDKILDSDKLRPGLRSIILMDTFQEESLEDSKLTADETNEAAMLIAQLEARRAGRPYVPAPSVIQQFGVGGTSPQQIGTTIEDSAGHTPVTAAVSSPTLNAPSNEATSSQYAVSSQHHPAQATNGHADEPVLGQHLQPTMGASTAIRDGNNNAEHAEGGRVTSLGGNALKAELTRLFESDAVVPSLKEKRRQVAQTIADAVEAQAGQRPSAVEHQAKWAIIDAAGSRRFVEAVELGILSPQQLAQLDVDEIRTKCQHLDALTEEQWRDHISEHSHKGDPEHLHDALRKMSSTSKGSSASSQKTHRIDDALALQAVMARRQSNKPSSANGSINPRLPGWAKEAIASHGRRHPSSEPSPSPSTSAPRPLPRSPFT